MIKNVLIPERIGNYYVFSKRIVGFYIDASTVSATLVYLKGSTVRIEQVLRASVGADDELSYEERVALVVKDLLGQIGRYDVIHTALASSQVIFKTLKLPFLKYEKLKMVVNFEVEPLLPFALDEAIIDFVVTRQFPQEGSSEIIVAAVQKSVVADHLSFFEQAGISPSRIGVDLFSLYGLYKRVPNYAQAEGNIALVDIGATATRVALMSEGQIRSVRVLPKGLETFVTAVRRARNSSYEDAHSAVATFGLTKQDDPTYYGALSDALGSFWSGVQFTLSSFVAQGQEQSISKFVLTGVGAHIAGLTDFVSDKSHVACELFQVTQLIADRQLRIKGKISLSAQDLTSLGTALLSPETMYFNLLPLHMRVERDTALLTKQVVAAGLFVVVVFVSLITHHFLRVGTLQQELSESRQDIVHALKKKFKSIRKEEDFDRVVQDAQDAVAQEETLWAPFASQPQFLKYLRELFASLDQKALGLVVDNITLTKDVMTLKARVKGFDELVPLQDALRASKLFRYEGRQLDTDFTMQIPLSRNG